MEIQLSDWVENFVGKGEIARYEQFLLFPQCFRNLSVVDASKKYLWSKGLIKQHLQLICQCLQNHFCSGFPNKRK